VSTNILQISKQTQSKTSELTPQTVKAMKLKIKNLVLAGLIVFAVVGAAVKGNSQSTVSVDPTRPWQGYMNVFSPDFSTLVFGQAWGTAALTAYFDASGTNSLILTANTK
jgi:hypothetical protein